MTISTASEGNLTRLIQLGKLLWPTETSDSLIKIFKETFYRQSEITFMASKSDDEIMGFAIFSIRNDYVEGASSSPVGYLEGLVVDDPFRESGVANSLVSRGVEWCRRKGCTQLGSDVEFDNKISQVFHERIGFREQNRVINYLKDIS